MSYVIKINDNLNFFLERQIIIFLLIAFLTRLKMCSKIQLENLEKIGALPPARSSSGKVAPQGIAWALIDEGK